MSTPSTAAIRVDNQWIEQLPLDLYIPPAAFEVLIDRFEGPLDFLLYLVRKNGLNLIELSIAPIAEQYVSYIKKLQAADIELAGEYLVMAALLADLKSRMLLPKPESTTLEEDPTATLIARLEAYAKIKQASSQLSMRTVLGRDVFAVPAIARPELEDYNDSDETFDPALLHSAISLLFKRPKAAPHTVGFEAVTIESRLRDIRAFIAQLPEGQVITFYTVLAPEQGRMGIAVSFMAILELARLGEITLIIPADHLQIFSLQINSNPTPQHTPQPNSISNTSTTDSHPLNTLPV